MFVFDFNRFSQSYESGFGKLKTPAVSGQEALLGFLEQDPEVTDVRWAAYMLATVKHECADRWRPIEEFGKGKATRMAGQSQSLTQTVRNSRIRITVAALCN